MWEPVPPFEFCIRVTSTIKFFRLFQPAPAAKKAAPKDTKAQKAQQKATKNVTKAAPRVGGKR
jgi:hypothetical protein